MSSSTSNGNARGVANGIGFPPAQSSAAEEAAQYSSLENFELGRKIGKGQFSEVLSGRNRLTGKMVALKKIEVGTRRLFTLISPLWGMANLPSFPLLQVDLMKNKKAREDCRKEIDLLKQLNHENIIRYYSSFIGRAGEGEGMRDFHFSGRPIQRVPDDRVGAGRGWGLEQTSKGGHQKS